MNEVILQRDHGEQNSGASSSVWASGIGFGGGDMDSVAAKQKRDILLKEATERESILIHAFNLFVKNIDTSSVRYVFIKLTLCILQFILIMFF